MNPHPFQGRIYAGACALVTALLCAGTPLITAAEIIVPAGGDFQAALDAAKPGDTIVLQAGASYRSTYGFVLPYKVPVTGTEADTITVTTSNLAGIPPEGVRVNPAIHAVAMPKLIFQGSGITLMAAPKAHDWKFVGLEVTNDGTADSPGLVNIGSGSTSEERALMKGFRFDRCFVHPAEISGTNLVTPERTSAQKAVISSVVDFRIMNSYIVGGGPVEKFSGTSGAGMAFGAPNGPGPILIENNYLEAFYSPLFFGGADQDPVPERTAIIQAGATIGRATLDRVGDMVVGDYVAFQIRTHPQLPQRWKEWGIGRITSVNGTTVSFDPLTTSQQLFDLPPMTGGRAQWRGSSIRNVVIRGNTVMANGPQFRHLIGKRYSKNWMEVKEVTGLLVEGNIFTCGIPTNITLYPQNENGGTPWGNVSNVTIRNNVIRNFQSAINLSLFPNYNVQQDIAGDIVISNNLMIGASPEDCPYGGSYFIGVLDRGHRITITHNTVLNVQSAATAQPPGARQLVVRDNIMRNGAYGWNCTQGGIASSSCYAGWTMKGNVIVDNRKPLERGYQLPYPSDNFLVDTDAHVGWIDPSSDNYRLSASSTYRGRATDGTDPGVNMDVLLASSPTPQAPVNVRLVR